MATGGLFTQSIIEASDAIYDFQCSPCYEEGKNTEALFKCVECDCFYCQRCLDGHRKFVKNHTVQDIKAIADGKHTKIQPLPAPPVSTYDMCREHHGKLKDMFCKQHDEVCCAVCIALNHKSCEAAKYIPKVAEELLKGKDVEKVKSDLENFTRDLRNLKSKQKEFLKTMDKQRTHIIKSIHDFKTQMLQLVDDLERSSVAEVEEKCKAISDDIKSDIEKTEQMINDVGTYLDKLTNNSNDNDAKLFVRLKEAEMQVLKADHYTTNLYAKPVGKIKYTLNRSLERKCKQMASFGNIDVSSHTYVPFVNILVRCDTRQVQNFNKSLQSELLNIGIHSQYIHSSGLVPNMYTLVLFNSPNQLYELDVKSQRPAKMILLQFKPYPRRLIQAIVIVAFPPSLPSWASDAKIISVPSTDSDEGFKERTLKELSNIII